MRLSNRRLLAGKVTMNVRLTCCIAALALLGACEKSQSPAPSAMPSTPAVAEATQVAPAPAAKPGQAVLIDGYVPDFPHRLRSQRQAADGEVTRHFVVVEYLDVDRDAAIAALSKSLGKAGYRVRGPITRTAGTQYAYLRPDGRRMDAIFSDPDSRHLVYPSAKGMVMFSWSEPLQK
jgi:hypothetical protein